MTSLSVNIPKLKNLMHAMPEIAAAYLFGSAAEGGPVVNDLDLLVLTFPGVNQDQAYFDILSRMANELGLAEEKIDLVFFDLETTDPWVLHSAITTGDILTNKDQKFLADRIEELSLFFLVNETFLVRAKKLRDEQLEDFCSA